MSRSEEECFIGLWLFTTLFWYGHEQFGDIFGECWWNPFPLFHYVSGYVGYLLMAHYIRTYPDWSWSRTLMIALPLLLVGYAICVYSFYTRSFVVDEVRQLELSWQTTSIAPVLMSFGAFMLIKKISCGKGRLYSCVRSISANSYGMYLMHMMILPFLFALINPLFPTAITIILTSVSTYVICYIITKILSLPRWGKYVVG